MLATRASMGANLLPQVVSWWENRKKTENGGLCRSWHHLSYSTAAACRPAQTWRPALTAARILPLGAGGAAGLQLMKRAASAGMLLASYPLPNGKRPCLEYMHLAAAAHHDQLLHHPPGPLPFPSGGGGGGAGAGHGGTYYATPEIVAVPLLAGGGSGQLPPLRHEGGPAGAPVFEELPQHGANPTIHGGGGFLQQLATNSEAAMFGELFPGGGGGGTAAAAAVGRGSQSPREQLQQGAGRLDGSGMLPPMANGGGGYYPQSPHNRREGSAENKEVGGGDQLVGMGGAFVGWHDEAPGAPADRLALQAEHDKPALPQASHPSPSSPPHPTQPAAPPLLPCSLLLLTRAALPQRHRQRLPVAAPPQTVASERWRSTWEALPS